MSMRLFGFFLERQLRITASEFRPVHGDAWEISRLLWPFFEPFQSEPLRTFVATTPYDPGGEAEFDSMLEVLAVYPDRPLPIGETAAHTVWHERIVQAMVTVAANAAQGRPLMLPPLELSPGIRHVATACMWLHEMELPFFPGTVSAPTSPPGRA